MNNYEGWHHIGTAPKDREVIVWDGFSRYIAQYSDISKSWHSMGFIIDPTHWRGCPPPPPIALPDDGE